MESNHSQSRAEGRSREGEGVTFALYLSLFTRHVPKEPDTFSFVNQANVCATTSYSETCDLMGHNVYLNIGRSGSPVVPILASLVPHCQVHGERHCVPTCITVCIHVAKSEQRRVHGTQRDWE